MPNSGPCTLPRSFAVACGVLRFNDTSVVFERLVSRDRPAGASGRNGRRARAGGRCERARKRQLLAHAGRQRGSCRARMRPPARRTTRAVKTACWTRGCRSRLTGAAPLGVVAWLASPGPVGRRDTVRTWRGVGEHGVEYRQGASADLTLARAAIARGALTGSSNSCRPRATMASSSAWAAVSRPTDGLSTAGRSRRAHGSWG